MREITYYEALREAIREEMIKDKNVILIGEDVGQGYGGVFGVSHGLYDEFGPNQVIDTPIAENTILGAGIGAALLGIKPIVEMMFSDFVAICFDGILNQAAKIRFMTADQYPFGKGSVVRKGKDLTIVAISYMVKVAQETAEELYNNSGIDIEIIDPRTLVLLDIDLIANSVKKTSRLVTLEESVLRGGIGAEITSIICEKYMDYLDLPIKKIASKNTHIAMTPSLENAVVPNKNRVVKEVKEMLGV